MSLQFYYGASGAGKSKKLHDDIIKASMKHPETNYLIIVPDQFTMQTQMDLVVEHPYHAIMNIDVLSFGRLTHRILEEVGYEDKPVLDDTGKSLVLRRVAESRRDELVVMGKHLNKIGYIHEVKSAISEFMQYGIGYKELEQLTEYAKSRGALYHKLQDLGVLYKAFGEYTKEKFITTEETLDILCRALSKSAIVRNSVIAFDGFTGFTPIQYRVIRELLQVAAKVIVTIIMDERENPMVLDGEQKLFHLSKKTVKDIVKLAYDLQVPQEECVWCKEKINGRLPRFSDNEELAHLEYNLFRYPSAIFDGKTEKIRMFEASSPREEIRQTCIAIRKLLRQSAKEKNGSLYYRDIAVVTGNMEVYARGIEEEFMKFDIPIYMDQTRGILGNPFTEYIRSALKIVIDDFSYESVFHFLRTGLTDFATEEVDRLENYIRRFGIRGKKKWTNLFIYKEIGKVKDEEAVEKLAHYNAMREKLIELLTPLLQISETAGERVRALHTFLEQGNMQQKLAEREKSFLQMGDLIRAKEYGQVYRIVIDLLDQIYELLEKEPMTAREFADIIDSGLSEISVGTIPQNVDRIVVGDMERTRLKQVKVLFFLGINDGNIPKGAGKGGIISDIDREFLQGSDLELAPTPRQQMYIQRLYLYINMTKPSDMLFLSYAKVGNNGSSLRPAYLIDLLKKMFVNMEVTFPEKNSVADQIASKEDGLILFSEQLREYAANRLSKEQEKQLFTFYQAYNDDKIYQEKTNKLVDAAFFKYQHNPLSKMVTTALYGSMLQNSVSRLEKFAACAYSHFLQYGIALSEREEYSFESVDMGNVFHGILEMFADKLKERGHTWFDFDEKQAEELLQESLDAYSAGYGQTILYSSARNLHLMKRIFRIMKRTVMTLQTQLKKGAFVPDQFEMSFSVLENLDSLNIALNDKEKMRLRGRIDRIDTCETEDKVYVKIIDYKSGAHRFDLAALYYGLQLQLVVYMNAAMEIEQKKHPDKEVVPAALLYYQMTDPVLEDGEQLTAEQVNSEILQKLKMTGIVNQSDESVRLLDKEFTEKSEILPIARKKDGLFTSNSSVMDEQQLRFVSDYVSHKIRSLGTDIMQGTIAVNPYKQGENNACSFCSYKKICGFRDGQDGYAMRKLEKLTEQDAMCQMAEEMKSLQSENED